MLFKKENKNNMERLYRDILRRDGELDKLARKIEVETKPEKRRELLEKFRKGRKSQNIKLFQYLQYWRKEWNFLKRLEKGGKAKTLSSDNIYEKKEEFKQRENLYIY